MPVYSVVVFAPLASFPGLLLFRVRVAIVSGDTSGGGKYNSTNLLHRAGSTLDQLGAANVCTRVVLILDAAAVTAGMNDASRGWEGGGSRVMLFW